MGLGFLSISTVMTVYFGTYTDAKGSMKLKIKNDFSCLYAEIEGLILQGREFSDLTPINLEAYSSAVLERFTWLETPMLNSQASSLSLCNCSLSLPIEQKLIDTETGRVFAVNLALTYELGAPNPKPPFGLSFESVHLRLEFQGQLYQGRGDFMEIALDQIQQAFGQRYRFKNCYGCKYGDYNVYGQASFASMFCFLNQKQAYLNVESKMDYIKLWDLEKPNQVQEIYVCQHYEPRFKGLGYRG